MNRIYHYYGDIVRKLFLGGAVIMLLTLPFLNPLLPVPSFYSLLLIIIFSVVAGFTSPNTIWALWLNEGIAIIAVIVFEYYAVQYYSQYSLESSLFLTTQLLAFIFLIALYYNTKSLRARDFFRE